VILTQIEKVHNARDRLQRILIPQNGHNSTEVKAKTIIEALDHLRDILGNYAVDTDLTLLFRQQLEPDLANVWTHTDLLNYCHRLHLFSNRVDEALGRWKRKYCKEGKANDDSSR
jgi:hypothetical protein